MHSYDGLGREQRRSPSSRFEFGLLLYLGSCRTVQPASSSLIVVRVFFILIIGRRCLRISGVRQLRHGRRAFEFDAIPHTNCREHFDVDVLRHFFQVCPGKLRLA
jgi:hypothetical protein